MLSAIDHVGVAVPSIDSALALYRDALGMPLVHRETVTEQGVDAALLDVGDGHIELLEPLGPTRRSASSWTAGARACTTSPTGWRSVAGHPGRVPAAGLRLIDETPRDRHPRLAGRLPASRLAPAVCSPKSCSLLRKDTDMADDKPQKINIGFLGGPGPERPRGAGRADAACARRSGPPGWHDLSAEDGTIALDLEKVVYVLVDTEEHRVGFGT